MVYTLQVGPQIMLEAKVGQFDSIRKTCAAHVFPSRFFRWEVQREEFTDAGEQEAGDVDMVAVELKVFKGLEFLQETITLLWTDFWNVSVVVGAAHDAEIKKLGTGHA